MTTTVYIGNYLEWTGSTATMKKYYYAGGQRIAMRERTGTTSAGLRWLHTDHLGSTSAVVNAQNFLDKSLSRYLPWGADDPAHSTGTPPTAYRFTGQREDLTWEFTTTAPAGREACDRSRERQMAVKRSLFVYVSEVVGSSRAHHYSIKHESYPNNLIFHVS